MRGIMIMGVRKARLPGIGVYVEPVEVSGQGIEAAVKSARQKNN
jgi:hypothetical protein